jgi:hypothetical protein
MRPLSGNVVLLLIETWNKMDVIVVQSYLLKPESIPYVS